MDTPAAPVIPEQEKIVNAIYAGQAIAQHIAKPKRLGPLSLIEDNYSIAKAPLREVDVQYVATSITRSFE